MVSDFRPDSRITNKIELIWKLAKNTLEKKFPDKFHTFTTWPFKIKGALTQMKNICWTTVPLIVIHWTVNRELHPVLPVFISLKDTTQDKIGLLNTNKALVILQPHVLEFQQAVFPELKCCFPLFWPSFQHVLGWSVSVIEHVFFLKLF